MSNTNIKFPYDYEVGELVKFVSRDPYSWIKVGEIVRVTDIQEGMFIGDYYVTVESLEDNEKKASCHHWRFEKI